MKFNSNKRQGGFSLVEILLVLGIIAILAIGAFVIYPNVQTSNEAKSATDKYTKSVTAVKEFFGNRPYTGLTRASAIAGGLLTDADLTTPFGQISVAQGTQPRVVLITFATMDPKVCPKLLTRLEPLAAQLMVGATVIKRRAPVGAAIAFAPLTAAAACGSAPVTIQAWVD